MKVLHLALTFCLCWLTPTMITLETNNFSFTNDPEILEPHLDLIDPQWRLTFRARFANDCLADSGVVVAYADLPGPIPNESRSRRLLWVQQIPDPRGCPDIFLPVTRRFVAELTAEHGISELVLLNSLQSGSDVVEKELQVTRFDPDRIRKTTESMSGVSRQPAKTVLLFESPYFPPLSESTLLVEPVTSGRHSQYRLDFSVTFPSPCHADKGLEALLVESRTGVSDQHDVPVLEWLFVVNPDVAACSGSEVDPIVKRYSISRSFPTDYRRELVVTNTTANQPLDPRALFRVLPVWPLTRDP